MTARCEYIVLAIDEEQYPRVHVFPSRRGIQALIPVIGSLGLHLIDRLFCSEVRRRRYDIVARSCEGRQRFSVWLE